MGSFSFFACRSSFFDLFLVTEEADASFPLSDFAGDFVLPFSSGLFSGAFFTLDPDPMLGFARSLEGRQAKKEKEKGKEKAEDKKKENQEGAGKEKDKGTDKAKGKDAKKKTGGNEETEGEGGKKKAKEKDEKQKKNVVRSTKKRLRKAEPAWNYNHELTTKRYADDVRIICLPSTHRPDLLQRLLRMQRLLLLYCCGFRIADCCCDFSASPYRLFRGSPSRHITRKFSHGYFILIRSFRCHR